MICKIYLIENKINGKKYVGMTTAAVLHRWRDHLWYARSSVCGILAVDLAIRKYGEENFAITQIDSTQNSDFFFLLEDFWIEALGTLSPAGYNLRKNGEFQGSGNSGFRHSKEARERMSDAHRGKRHSPEAKARMSAAAYAHYIDRPSHMQGRKLSVETRAKIGLKSLGRELSPEARLKISVANSGRKRSVEAKIKMSLAQRKLTRDQASAIRLDPRSCRLIAKDFEVSAATVANVKRGLFYREDRR